MTPAEQTEEIRMSLLADIVRNYIGPASGYSERAILDAVDKCEELELDAPDVCEEILLTLVRSLNATVPVEHADEVRQIVRKHR